MNIILAHDSFTQLGGAERVFLGMAEMYPDAPIYTLAVDKKIARQLPENIIRRLHVSPLQILYRYYPNFQHLLPFIPLALRLMRLTGFFDNKQVVVLSSSSAFIKGLQKPAFALHINYCHTPTRFLWTDSEYLSQEVPYILRPFARLFLRWLKRWDLRAVSRVDVFIANSKEVHGRIKKYYKRDSEVVYPFIDTEFWKRVSRKQKAESGMDQKRYFLIAGRLQAHKHNDLVIEICNELKMNLHVVGQGRDLARLKALAGPTIKFLGRTTDLQLQHEYANAEAYVYPQLEDFGMMPIEAAACGTPTIGMNAGGSMETIIPGVTGEHYIAGNKESLKKLIAEWDKGRYNKENLLRHAEKFSKEAFVRKIQSIIDQNNKLQTTN